MMTDRHRHNTYDESKGEDDNASGGGKSDDNQVFNDVIGNSGKNGNNSEMLAQMFEYLKKIDNDGTESRLRLEKLEKKVNSGKSHASISEPQQFSEHDTSCNMT